MVILVKFNLYFIGFYGASLIVFIFDTHSFFPNVRSIVQYVILACALFLIFFSGRFLDAEIISSRACLEWKDRRDTREDKVKGYV